MIVIVLLTLTLLLPITESLMTSVEPGHYLNQFAIRLKHGDREVAEDIALSHGFVVRRELRSINVFLLEHPEVNHRSERSAESHLQKLLSDDRIAHAQQEVALHRVKRRIVYDKQLELPVRNIEDDSVYKRVEISNVEQRDNLYTTHLKYSDPKYKDMWYLDNRGQSGGEKGLDLNIDVVWANGFTGRGVRVTILDDGVDYRHPDLKDNYDPDASTDLNDKSDLMDDPMPDTTDMENSHGTRCAGEVAAAANNDVCGVGVAYEASIGGIRILDGSVTDALEAEALRFNSDYIHIYSASWGPSDDGATMEGPRELATSAIQEGARLGRKGLGSIFVWATGNGGMNDDDCNCDGYVSMPETLSIGAVNDWGRSPFFTENCTSTLAVVPSGGDDYIGQEDDTEEVKLKVVTTDMNGGCIENFQGTSSAAPLAAGCLAVVLQANPSLSYRDVQHVVVQGSRIPSADNSWIINGAGHHVSQRFGFGLMNCGKMVELAQTWNNIPEQRTCNTTKENYQMLKKRGMIADSIYINGCPGKGSSKIDRLEHVQVYIKMSSHCRGNTVIVLISPAGTRSRLLSPRVRDNFQGDWEFSFMTVFNWDENPTGKWTLEVHDFSSESRKDTPNSRHPSSLKDTDHVVGYIKQWSLALHGTHGTRHGRAYLQATHTTQKSYTPSQEDVLEIKRKELEQAKKVQVKRAQGSLPISETGNMKKSNMAEDRLVQRLWDLLHNQEARTFKKRILQTSEPSISPRKKIAKTAEIRSLVDSLTKIVEKMESEKKRH